MKFMFNPTTKKTVVINHCQIFSLEDASNGIWNNPINVDKVVPLREGKNACSMFIDIHEYGFLKFLEKKYNAKNRVLRIGVVRIPFIYLHNEVGEPFIKCYAKLPNHVLLGIMSALVNEYLDSINAYLY